jgi:hypothetical protein
MSLCEREKKEVSAPETSAETHNRQSVTRTFVQAGQKVTALHKTTFSAHLGEFIAIIGPSGSGKSTLLTIAGGLQSPSQGEVLVNGNSFSDKKEKMRAKLRFDEIGFILQEQYLFTGTVGENIVYGNHEFEVYSKTKLEKLLKDISLVPANWSGNAVGTGFIYSGHNDNSPNKVLAAGALDSDGYFGTGNSSSSGANQKRTLVTSKGDVIWDFAGNLWEQMYEGQNIGGTSTWAEYTVKADTHPFDPKLISGYDWNSTQGIGQTYGDNNVATINSITSTNPSYWLLRGGYWYNASDAGLFASHWNAASLASRGYSVSVRCIAKKQ